MKTYCCHDSCTAHTIEELQLMARTFPYRNDIRLALLRLSMPTQVLAKALSNVIEMVPCRKDFVHRRRPSKAPPFA